MESNGTRSGAAGGIVVPIGTEKDRSLDKKTIRDLDLFPPNWNITSQIEDIPLNADFAWLLFLLLIFMIWVTYYVYYHSRVSAFIVTIILNTVIFPRYLFASEKKRSRPYIRIGSLSVSFISGKIMFRDLALIYPDYTLRVLDGFVIFRWWVPYYPKDVRTMDCSQEDTRLFSLLSGFELHVFNRSQLYHNLEKIFNLPSKLFPFDDGQQHQGEHESCQETDPLSEKKAQSAAPTCNDDLITSYLWRDLIPVTKIEISTGKFVFGNSMTPTILSFNFDEAHVMYTSKPSSSPQDLFTHIAKSKFIRFKVILVPSPKYLGLTDEPPRYMGEGFVVIQCKAVEFYYYQDEPGFVSQEAEKVQLVTGDLVQKVTFPLWGLDVKCEKSCTFSYGPWADRQREYLYNYFYPIDYQDPVIASEPQVGQMREFQHFEFRLNLLASSMIDILFMRENRETNVLHVGAGPGSCLEIRVPWITKETGYQSHIKGQILHLDAKTCLNYRCLAESETLEFDCKINYPKHWNDHQEWLLNLVGHRATVNLIFAHKLFFTDLIDDWADKNKPEILKFVPYTWKINLILKEFELITLANEGNWIDCSASQYSANTQLAICGDDFELSFDLPFIDFLPVTLPIKLWIQGQNLDASIHVPRTNANRDIIQELDSKSILSSLNEGDCGNNSIKRSKVSSSPVAFLKPRDLFPTSDRWRRYSVRENGWITCWSVPIVAISINYTYHPSPVLPPPTQPVPEMAFIDNEDILLQPLKPDSLALASKRTAPPSDFCPGSMTADVLDLEIEIGPSTVCLYGIILKMLWDLKENYVGESRSFTDITEKPQISKIRRLPFSRTTPVTFIESRAERKAFDARLYRPFEVKISLAMHDINAHLMKASSIDNEPCPYIYFERLSFEMDKRYTETKMQLLLSPVVLNAADCVTRPQSFKHLNEGSIILNSLQFRGHAMFSEIGRPLESDTLEYAWLIDVQLGDISGRLTLPQLSSVIAAADTLAGGILLKDSVQPPAAPVKCIHDANQLSCPESELAANKICPNPEDIKYRIIRVSLSRVDFSLAELHTLTNVSIIPVRVSTCNVHGSRLMSGVTMLIDKITMKQFLLKESSSSLRAKTDDVVFDNLEDNWVQVVALSFGPIFLDTASTPPITGFSHKTDQDKFLRLHDDRFKRLWFLWRRPSSESLQYSDCGCVGGCAFLNGRLEGRSYFDSISSGTERRKRRDRNPEGLRFGESLLRRGEAVMGFSHNLQPWTEAGTATPAADAEDDDDDDVTLRGSAPPIIRKSCSPEMTKSMRINSDDDIVYPIRLSSSHPKAQKISFVQRQLSSPTARSSPVTSNVTPLQRSQMSSYASIRSPTTETGAYVDALTHISGSQKIPTSASVYLSIPHSRHSFSEGTAEEVSDIASEILISSYSEGKMKNMRTKSLGSQSTVTDQPYYSADEGDSDSATLKTAPESRMKQTISVVSEDKSLFSALDVMLDEDPQHTQLFDLDSANDSGYLPGRVFEEIRERDESVLRSDKTKVLVRIDGTTGFNVSPTSSGGLRTMTETISDIIDSVHLKYLKFPNEETSVETPASPRPRSSGDFIIEIDKSQVLLHRQSPAPRKKVTNVPNIIYGAFKLEKVTSCASISGVKVEGGLGSLSVTMVHNQRVRTGRDKWTESSLRGEVESSKISLFEEGYGASSEQLIMKMSLGKTKVIISAQSKNGKETNSATFLIGALNLDIPQQPSTLHGMVYRSSRQISSTLQELRSSRQPLRSQKREADNRDSVLISMICTEPVEEIAEKKRSWSRRATTAKPVKTPPIIVIGNKEFIVQFNISLDSFTIGAALLPSLRAQYQIGKLSSNGITGEKANFVIDLLEHSLSFSTSGQQVVGSANVETTLPSFAKVALPSIHVAGDYLEIAQRDEIEAMNMRIEFGKSDILRKSLYMNTVIDIGFFEHSLTTDLLNHLIVIQKEFVKEINDVVLKMSGGDMIVIPTAPANSEGGRRSLLRMSQAKADLFKFSLSMKGTRVTANTPTNSAVRFCMGPVDLQMSNLTDEFVRDSDSTTSFSLKFLSCKIEVELNVACRAEYVIAEIVSTGITGDAGNFVIDVPEHHLSFETTATLANEAPLSLPSSTKVSMPPIHVSADYREDSSSLKPDSFEEGVVLRKGTYLHANADVDFFEHSLTTDLLNHVILVQKEFMKEVNLVLQKLTTGGDISVIPIVESGSSGRNMPAPELDLQIVRNQPSRANLFSLHLSLKGIQITATTPTNNAVRLETGEIQFQLSNRVESPDQASALQNSIRTFFRLQFDFNVGLGQLIRNPVFDEAEAEFQPFAYFKTRVVIRNSFRDEYLNPETNMTEQRELILVTLNRPLIYIQPLALDKAVIVWLNYKNAYEAWNEQRAAMNPMSETPMQPVQQPLHQLSGQSLGALFLQLTFDDLGICLPITQMPNQTSTIGSKLNYDGLELKSALVVTLESTTISASAQGSLVSKGKFNGLCFRFADDFETSLDDWKPEPSDSTIMNIGVVSEGTYEICSRTTTGQALSGSRDGEAKWYLNVSWRMQGFDIHVDTSIGKQLSALFSTLTALAGDEDAENGENSYDSVDTGLNQNLGVETDEQRDRTPKTPGEPEEPNIGSSQVGDGLPRRVSLMKDYSFDSKKRSRLIEKELNEQAKVINSLRQEGVSQEKLEAEIKKLHELEFAIFNDFRRDVMKKLRRQSSKPQRDAPKRYERSNLTRMPTMISPEKQDDEFASSVLQKMRREDALSSIGSETETLSPMAETPDGHALPVFDTKSDSSASVKTLTSSDSTLKNKSRSTSKSTSSDSGSDPYLAKTAASAAESTSESESSSDSVSQASDAEAEAAIAAATVASAAFAESRPDARFEHKRHVSLGGSGNSSLGYGTRGIHQPTAAVQEPNIDFELEVMVYFDSGKCVFHTRDKDPESSEQKKITKERSFNALLDPNNAVGSVSNPIASPKFLHPRYQNRSLSGTTFGHHKTNSLIGLKGNISSSRLRQAAHQTSTHSTDTTVFLIPGLDVKVHYNSKNVLIDAETSSANASLGRTPSSAPSPLLNRDPEFFNTSAMSLTKKVVSKKASLSAWMTLHCIPEETVITPHILDFLEQALEPIAIIESPKITTPSSESPPADAEDVTSVPAQYAVYGSFPVDVIVYLHVQPSVLRFSCLPVSRVECLLQLPSVELTFSSKRDEDQLNNGDPSSPPGDKSKSLPGKVIMPFKNLHRRGGSDYRGVSQSQTLESSVAGLSITGCLADFSLYIFHPYGGQKKTNITTPSSLNQDSVGKPFTGRKDSLSLQVEFVKIDISRSRKLIFSMETSSPRYTAAEKQVQSAIIRFSAACDVGSASFKYDMRRLSEILAFPKAWYRKAIWKRMFLGDESIRSNLFTDSEEDVGFSSDSSDHVEFEVRQRTESGESSPSLSTETRTPPTRQNLWLNLNEAPGGKKNRDGEWRGFTPASHNGANNGNNSSHPLTGKQAANAAVPWETLVVFTLNLSKLNIQMNMGNVMGNTTWLSRGFQSEGRVNMDSVGHKGYMMKLKLDASSLDAKGGIVGGIIELSNIETEFSVKEDRGREPNHRLKLKLHTFQKRLDYMGTSILMFRISDLDLTLNDEWVIDHQHHVKSLSGAIDHPTKRPAHIFVHSHLDWDQVQILMSKSTTPDIIKICSKLEEFFSQQFHSSVRVLSSLEPSTKTYNRSSLKSRPKRQQSIQHSAAAGGGSGSSQEFAILTEARHHRHWQRALRAVSGITVTTLPAPLPAHGTILGGTVELTGKHISLACFYGINFRSKAWGLFSLKQPMISFATECQDVMNEVEGMDTHIVQNLSVSLGRARAQDQQDPSVNPHSTMATVCKMSRSVAWPPQFRNMHEWFAYAFATSQLDEVNRFPVIEFDRTGTDLSSVTVTDGAAVSILSSSGESKRRISASPKSQEYHHMKEVIFALPSFQVELKTEHLQAPRTPVTSSPKPSVDCTFVVDFDDHIFVAVDAEAYFFLHELITSYIRERETPYNKMSQSPTAERSRKSKDDSTESLVDWREFICHTWHLEPTVRLLSWAGRNIDPPGVDFILQRLGFSHARTTIPKWIQRGAMDPLDKILAVVMHRCILANSVDKTVDKSADGASK